MVAAAKARQRSLYGSAAAWSVISARAAAAGMSVSRFVVGCALSTGDDGSDAPLVLTVAEQHELVERLARLDRCNRALMERLPGTKMSLLDGLAFLVRAHQRSGGGEVR